MIAQNPLAAGRSSRRAGAGDRAVRALVGGGADTAAVESGYGATRVDWAAFAGHDAVVALLRAGSGTG